MSKVKHSSNGKHSSKAARNAAIRQDLLKGFTLRELCYKYGLHKSTISTITKGMISRRNRRAKAAIGRNMEELHKQGMTNRQISEMYSIPLSTVEDYRRAVREP